MGTPLNLSVRQGQKILAATVWFLEREGGRFLYKRIIQEAEVFVMVGGVSKNSILISQFSGNTVYTVAKVGVPTLTDVQKRIRFAQQK